MAHIVMAHIVMAHIVTDYMVKVSYEKIGPGGKYVFDWSFLRLPGIVML